MVKKVLDYFKPPDGWRLLINFLIAVLLGLGLFLFHISKASSYLSDDPKACVNCHIMAPQYATHAHSSHREWTHCNDCHVPHNNILNKYYFKAKDGLRHSTIFTLRREPQVIFIHKPGREVVQSNCVRCHMDLLNDQKFEALTLSSHKFDERQERPCWDCHREVPHGRVNSLSSVPNPMLFLQSDKTVNFSE